MFKVESYITPILLSYVDKYVQDFKSADAQVSLWSGGVALHNLVLKPDIIQKELNLPFYLTSGRIHELLIQVPWMKLVSEPIVITINTIECILMLKEEAQIKVRRETTESPQDVLEAPPTYAQSLIKKIVNNISIRCRNLILKYVEDDIVVSVNIKNFTLDSANENWTQAFTEILPNELILRKLIKLDNFTFCLDKSNAAGKIENYQEPLLYRCELEFRIETRFQSLSLKRPIYSHISVISKLLEFSLSVQQVPMMYRLILLLKSLKDSELKVKRQYTYESDDESNSDGVSLAKEQSWTQWAWSFVPTISSIPELSEHSYRQSGPPVFIFTLAIERICIIFKVTELVDSVTGSSKKQRYRTIVELLFKKIALQFSKSGFDRMCLRGGFDTISLLSEGPCVCGHSDYNAKNGRPSIYLLSEQEEVESKSWPVLYNMEEFAPMDVDELILHSPGFAVQMIHIVHLPPQLDLWFEPSDFALDASNYEEERETIIVIGAFDFHISAGLIHRFNLLYEAFKTYDYTPYTEETFIKPDQLPVVTLDELMILKSVSWQHKISLIAFKPCIQVAAWDHKPTEIVPSGRRKSPGFVRENSGISIDSVHNLPMVGVQLEKFDAFIKMPLYPKRLVYTACQMPEIHPFIWKECHFVCTLKCDNLICMLSFPLEEQLPDSPKSSDSQLSALSNDDSCLKLPRGKTTTIGKSDLSIMFKSLVMPEYFTIDNTVKKHISIKIEETMICTTLPRLMTAYYVISSAVTETHAQNTPLYTTSLIEDSTVDSDIINFDLTISQFLLRGYMTMSTYTFVIVLDSVKGFAVKPMLETMAESEQAWLISAPDNQCSLLRLAMQYNKELHPGNVNYIGLWTEPASLCLDPYIVQWFTYVPMKSKWRDSTSSEILRRQQTFSSIRPKLYTNVHSTGRSSTDKDSYHSGETPTTSNQPQQSQSAERNSYDNTSWLKNLYAETRVWIIYIELGLTTVHFPTGTISAMKAPTMQSAIEGFLVETYSYNPEVLTFLIGGVTLRSTTSTKHFWSLVNPNGPTIITDADVILGLQETSSFPWKLTISDITCRTVAKKEKSVGMKSIMKQVTRESTVLELFTVVVTLSVTTKKKVRKKEQASLVTTSTNQIHPLEKLDNVSSISACIHIEVTPISVALYEVQVVLIVKVLHGLRDLSLIMASNINFLKSLTRYETVSTTNIHQSASIALKDETIFQRPNPSVLEKKKSNDSLVMIFKRNSIVGQGLDNRLKVTVFTQLSLSKVSIKVFGYTSKLLMNPDCKLGVEMEDIVMKVDIDHNYIKFKLNIFHLIVKHYNKSLIKSTNDWNPGDCFGFVLRSTEDPSKGEDYFLTFSMTMARTASVQQRLLEEDHGSSTFLNFFSDATANKAFLYEISITLKSLEMIFNAVIMERYTAIFDPIIKGVQCVSRDRNYFVLDDTKPASLVPLLYFVCQDIKIMIPSQDYLEKKPEEMYDVFVIDIEGITLHPNPDNPIIRNPVNSVIYQNAINFFLTSLPGCNLEDRQFMFSINNLNIYTAYWTQISAELEKENIVIHENPALLWTRKKDSVKTKTPIIVNLEINIIYAVPMLWEEEVVCGPAIELNLVTDIDFNLSLAQIKLLLYILNEMEGIFLRKRSVLTKPLQEYMICPYNDYYYVALEDEHHDFEEILFPNVHIMHDSGIDSTPSLQTDSGVLAKKFNRKKSVSIHELSPVYTPAAYTDFYFTAGKIKLNLYRIEKIEPDPAANASKETFQQNPLFWILVHQPNLYISKREAVIAYRGSIFDFGINTERKVCPDIPVESAYTVKLIDTMPGEEDFITGIRPTLVSVSFTKNEPKKCSCFVSVDRPVRFQFSTERVLLVRDKINLIKDQLSEFFENRIEKSKKSKGNILSQLKSRFLIFDEIIYKSKQIQILLYLPEERQFILQFENMSGAVLTASRPDKITFQMLIEALIVSNGEQYIIKPVTIGIELRLCWESWLKMESSLHIPMTYLLIDIERLLIVGKSKFVFLIHDVIGEIYLFRNILLPQIDRKVVDTNSDNTLLSIYSSTDSDSQLKQEYYYKDDLRIGAFKVVQGGQLPMAYQVTLDHSTVTWKYPHPRAITRIFSFPIPIEDSDGSFSIRCVLEYYCEELHCFLEYVYFYLRENAGVKLLLYNTSPRTVFASIWRIRMIDNKTPIVKKNFVFSRSRFQRAYHKIPHTEFTTTVCPGNNHKICASTVVAALRVDSYFAPALIPRVRVMFRATKMELFVHNVITENTDSTTGYSGYYVSKALKKKHPMLTLQVQNTNILTLLTPTSEFISAVSTNIGIYIFDSGTSEFRKLINPVDVDSTLWVSGGNFFNTVEIGKVCLPVYIKKILTLHLLLTQWKAALQGILAELDQVKCSRLTVRYLIVNYTDTTIRFGQVDTIESLKIEPKSKFAYRWFKPIYRRKMRLSTIHSEWKWSEPFDIEVIGSCAIKLCHTACSENYTLYANVRPGVELQGYRVVRIYGRLTIWNMIPHTLQFKVTEKRERETTQIVSGTLNCEEIDRSVIAKDSAQLYLKLKFDLLETGWTGEIPLKPCDNASVPWLVKIPYGSKIQFVSIWCRVMVFNSRLLVTLWTLYELHSYLPVHVDMTIETEELGTKVGRCAFGRGAKTTFLTSGTTTTKHTLSFKYVNSSNETIQQVVPLHYGVIDRKIFECFNAILTYDEVSLKFKELLGGKNEWPFSIVSQDMYKWNETLYQPNMDVIVRYKSVPWSCVLVIEVTPWALLINATDLPFILRAYDFSFICHSISKCVVAPPKIIIEREFFITFEVVTETWSSIALKISDVELGPYQQPELGHIHLDHSSQVLIHCKDQICAFAIERDYSTNKWRQPAHYKRVPAKQHLRCEGIIINKFWLPEPSDNVSMDPSTFQYYLQFSLSDKKWTNKPVRIDTSKKRFPVVINSKDLSVPCVVTSNEYNGRIWFGLHNDPCPQFLVVNKTNYHLLLATYNANADINASGSTSTAHVMTEEVDCFWQCVLNPNSQSYYNSPEYSRNYPVVPCDSQLVDVQLLLALMTEDHSNRPHWSSPISVTYYDNEQILMLANDICVKITVEPHVHSTNLHINYVTSNELAAAEVRRRLEEHKNTSSVLVENQSSSSILMDIPEKTILKPDESIREIKRLGAESNLVGKSAHRLTFADSQSNSVPMSLPSEMLLDSQSSTSLGIEFTSNSVCHIKEDAFKPMRLNLFIESVEIILGRDDRSNTLSVNLSSILVNVMQPHSNYSMNMQIGDIQIDNPGTSEENPFDFPVVLVGQTCSTLPSDGILVDAPVPLLNTFGGRHLAEMDRSNLDLHITLELDKFKIANKVHNEVNMLLIKIGPMSAYLEDSLITALVTWVAEINLPVLITPSVSLDNFGIVVPPSILNDAINTSDPIRFKSLVIDEIDLLLSVHTSVRLYIALDHSPLRLERFTKESLVTSPMQLGHAMALHYLSGCIVGAGWVVGSLEILGSPGTLVRKVGTGLKDLILEPWRGLSGGAKCALYGAGVGAASLAKNVAGGAVSSVSLMCGSFARNLDLVSLDDEHAKRAAVLRRKRPDNLLEALGRGFTGLAITLLGAIGGLAHHPLVATSCESDKTNPISMASGITRGLLGVVTKPLSATADFVALAGRGILSQTGWDSDSQPQSKWLVPEAPDRRYTSIRWSFNFPDLLIIYSVKARGLIGEEDYGQLLLIVTNKWFIVIDMEEDIINEMIDMRQILSSKSFADGRLVITLPSRSDSGVNSTQHETFARVAAYTGATDDIYNRVNLTFYMSYIDSVYLANILNAWQMNQSEKFFTACSLYVVKGKSSSGCSVDRSESS